MAAGNLHLPTAQQSWRTIFTTHTHTHMWHTHTRTHTHTHLLQNHPKNERNGSEHRSLHLFRALSLSFCCCSQFAVLFLSLVWAQLLGAARERMRSASSAGLGGEGGEKQRSSCSEHKTRHHVQHAAKKRVPNNNNSSSSRAPTANAMLRALCSASVAGSVTASVSASVAMPPIGNASANREEPQQSAIRS